MKKQINFDQEAEDEKRREIKEVKSQLPKRCSYKMISEKLAGKYKPDTIKHMFAGRRTMSPLVLDAAKKLIEFIKPEANAQDEPIEK